MRVCVDASLALDLVLPSEQTDKAESLWRRWAEDGGEIIGPPLLFLEATSVIRERVHKGDLSEQEGEEAFQSFWALGILQRDYSNLYVRAWQLAREFKQRKAYDAYYLALAEKEQCQFWTADERLANTVRRQFSWVRTIAANL